MCLSLRTELQMKRKVANVKEKEKRAKARRTIAQDHFKQINKHIQRNLVSWNQNVKRKDRRHKCFA